MGSWRELFIFVTAIEAAAGVAAQLVAWFLLWRRPSSAQRTAQLGPFSRNYVP